jgi:hypothetical protein
MSDLATIMRSYKGESDLQLIVDLFDACERVDRLEQSISTAQLRLALEAHGLDRERDLSLWEDAKSGMLPIAMLSAFPPTSRMIRSINRGTWS